ncbi:MAG: fumarylacetoacetate hydrolase family protein [Gammaproteobacteria bacterium]|nr:fumarylacetoacetate hydrolase family protein [Gammaproteobacteria bacterium]NNC96861.1 fumarylacetoacetate hydrolase family protein [Gammaproteobacteria bacterium]NNM13524.1 fumarylacetoacetate hydrolase family protein [Gammaproteobacteria bacterium]
MRLATLVHQTRQTAARVVDDHAYLATGDAYRSVLDIIDAGPVGLDAFSDLDRLIQVELKECKLLAPIPRPRSNIMCLGLNYLEHVNENSRIMGRKVNAPEHPIVFTKAPGSVNSPQGDIVLDTNVTRKLDWEVELAVVIGKGGKGILASNAMQHVFGYTVLNDVTARDLQRQHKQFFIGKSLDGACPMGPLIVTADEIGDPHELDICSRVNDQIQQTANTRQMMFKVPEIIEILSRTRTLEAGDIIATGTPSGVGVAQDPPRFLQAGDILESEISGIGCLRNQIIAE